MALQGTVWLGFAPGDSPPQYDARQDRQVLDTIAWAEGVVRLPDLKVTSRAAGANLTVDIAPGKAYISGDAVTGQGKYLQENLGTDNVGGFSVPGSGTSVYEVWLQINDKQSGASSSYTPQWVVRPQNAATLTNAIMLALVNISSTQSSIQAQHITDVRSFAPPIGHNTVQQFVTYAGTTDGSGYLFIPHSLPRKPVGAVVTMAGPMPNTGIQAVGVTTDIAGSTTDHVKARVWRATAYYVHPNAAVSVSAIVW